MTSATTDRRFGLVGNTSVKAPVTVVATGNITLSGQQTIDGVAVLAINSAGIPDRVLCTAQTNPIDNGIWDVSTASWTRSLDANGNYDLTQGSVVQVYSGSAGNASTFWTLTTSGSITIGTTALTWVKSFASTIASLGLSAPGGSSLIGFIAPGTGAVSRTQQDKDRDTLSVKDYGAVGDGIADDTADIQAAVNAAIAAGQGSLHIPAGIYKISSEISITSPLIIVGDGLKKTIIRQTSATANGLNFNYAALTEGGGIASLTVESGAGWYTAGFTGTGSSGIGVRLHKINGNAALTDVSVHNFGTSFAVLGSWQVIAERCRAFYFTGAGILIDVDTGGASGGGGLYSGWNVSNNGFTGVNTASTGIRILATGGETFYSVANVSSNRGWAVEPVAGKNAFYLWFDSCLGDTNVSDAWTFDSSAGKVMSVQCHNCWGAFSTNGSGLVTKGATLDSVRWVGGRLRENGAHGWSHLGGINCDVIGAEIAANSRLGAGLSNGVQVAAGVSSWGIECCRIGNFASGGTNQGDSINIAAGASQNFRIIGNDLNNPGAGKSFVVNGSNSINFQVNGNLPVQGSGTNNTRGALYPGNTVGTVAAAATVYLGPNGAQAAELDNLFISGRAGVITQVLVLVDAAPGAGQTYTYTLRKNGVATAATGTINGATTFSLVLTTPIAVSGTDNFSVQLVTSAGATATKHRWSIAIDA